MSPPWTERRVLVAMGSGGVGKTTTAAALALAAAAAGRRTLVMTIDPARRLADALGLEDLGNVARQLDPDALAAVGLGHAASLHVMMPDVKSTFDGLVRQVAPSSAQAEAILNNPLYGHFSAALAGSHEYAAIEQLYAAYHDGAYDLIVLDTPPAQNAFTFLEAPERVLAFMAAGEGGLPSWLQRPGSTAGRVSARLMDLGSNLVFRALSRLAGADILHQLGDLLSTAQGLYAGFRSRCRSVQTLLRAPELGYVLVTAPTAQQAVLVTQLRAALAERGMRAQATVVNRLRPAPPAAAEQAREAAELATLGAAAQPLLAAVTAEYAHVEQQAQWLAELRRAAEPMPLFCLPELLAPPDALAALAELQAYFSR